MPLENQFVAALQTGVAKRSRASNDASRGKPNDVLAARTRISAVPGPRRTNHRAGKISGQTEKSRPSRLRVNSIEVGHHAGAENMVVSRAAMMMRVGCASFRFLKAGAVRNFVRRRPRSR